MQQTIFVGLDLGSSSCHQTVINSDGGLLRSRCVPTSEQHLRNAFAELEGDVHVHAEASELSNWVRSIIHPMVSRFIISHPRSLAWIAKDSVKDDAVDARKLAELLRLGQVHEVYYEERASRRSFKQLVDSSLIFKPRSASPINSNSGDMPGSASPAANQSGKRLSHPHLDPTGCGSPERCVA